MTLMYWFGCKNNLFYNRKRMLRVDKAPEPSDVFWENLGVSHFQKFLRRSIVWIVTGCIIYLCYLAIKILKTESEGDSTLSLISSFLIYFINVIIQMTVKKFSLMEKHSTYTRYYSSYSMKLTWCLFANTCMIIYFVNMATLDNHTEPKGYIFKEGGLLTDVSTIMITDMIYPAVFLVIDI